jgi:hypothetical protein
MFSEYPPLGHSTFFKQTRRYHPSWLKPDMRHLELSTTTAETPSLLVGENCLPFSPYRSIQMFQNLHLSPQLSLIDRETIKFE